MPSENQRKLEKFTAEKIISLCGEAYQFARLGDDRQEPDVILKGRDVLGIEVTLGYYQGDQDDPTFYAHEIWNFVENPTFDHGVHRIVDPRTGKRKKVLDPTICLYCLLTLKPIDRRRQSHRILLPGLGNRPIDN